MGFQLLLRLYAFHGLHKELEKSYKAWITQARQVHNQIQ